jgi:hypothetical protein
MRSSWFAAAVMALVTGCDSSAPAGSPAATSEDISMTMSFSQLLPDMGTERGLLRVVNEESTDLHVTGLGLDWPGYGGAFHQDKDTTILADHTLDLRFTLPAPDCESDDDAPAVGTVESGGTVVRRELLESGQVLLRRLWRFQCAALFVADRLAIEYGDRWRPLGTGKTSTALGTLELTRRAGDEPVRLVAVEGSVLYGLRLPGQRQLEAGEVSASLPVEILPGNRCDEHARGQATAPFAFRLSLRIGRAPVTTVPVEPPVQGRREAAAALDRACA